MFRQKKADEPCYNDDERQRQLALLPRDADTFWRNDRETSTCKLSGHAQMKKSMHKGMSFTHRERQLHYIHGLMPVAVRSMEQQVKACGEYFSSMSNLFQKLVYLSGMEASNRKLFYALLIDDPKRYMPLLSASSSEHMVQHYSNLCLTVRGMFVNIKDKGHIYELLKNYPQRLSVRCLMVTNGASVLSIGDYGANAMAGVVYEMHSHVVNGGMSPEQCLPICLDVGTNNAALLQDDLYVGLKEPRVVGPAFEAFFEEFTLAVMRIFGPRTLIHCQNFESSRAVRRLEMYRKRQCYVDVNMQCRAACALAAVLVVNQLNNAPFRSNMLLFYGADCINVGMARLCLAYLMRDGLNELAARKRIWFCDAHGLIVHNRCKQRVPEQLEEFKQWHAPIDSLVEAIAALQPNVLIGGSSEPLAFDKAVLNAMEQSAQLPIIFALSQPMSRAECTGDQAFVHTKGRCYFITGSEAPPVKYANKIYQPGFCSTDYMLPGITQGVTLSGMTHVPDETFCVVADCLSHLVWPNDLARRYVYPPMRKLRCVNLRIAEAVFMYAYRRQLATLWPRPDNPRTYIASKLYKREYSPELQRTYCMSSHLIGTAESAAFYKENA
ncbi:CG7848 [Drosophila busckii]|uniref:CG7848 n=1 Tax=Drosophila busckii TaxID=30019 RepID=A0A0M3QV33_DROBS|nr:NADP-dependent malic enzyme [Drosophila busckii]ALC41683.1 CG7848 [Drosophila busckii]